MPLLHRFSVDRVRTRLLAAFAILLLAGVALAVVGWLGMRSMQLSYVYLDVKGATVPLLAKTQRDDITIDDVIPFEFPAQSMHVFRADGMAQARPQR